MLVLLEESLFLSWTIEWLRKQEIHLITSAGWFIYFTVRNSILSQALFLISRQNLTKLRNVTKLDFPLYNQFNLFYSI